MAELVFVLTDFFRPRRGGGGDAGAGLPRLPLLETLLARASPLTWRRTGAGWLAVAAGESAAPAASRPATVADGLGRCGQRHGQAPGSCGSRPRCITLPASIAFIFIRPACCGSSAREQSALVADFARVFADSPWPLRSLGQRELLLSGPAIAASGADPARFAGSDPSAGLPRGEGAAALRGLGAEMEMWLYEHPLNLERSRRGELPVTTLWLWGAEANAATTRALCTPARRAPAALLYGRDTYAEALWRLQGSQGQALPAAFDEAPIDADVDHIFLYSLLQPDGLTAALLQFEQRWLPGALRALRAGRVSVLRLVIGARAYSVRWLELARFWRARAPWWETLA